MKKLLLVLIALLVLVSISAAAFAQDTPLGTVTVLPGTTAYQQPADNAQAAAFLKDGGTYTCYDAPQRWYKINLGGAWFAFVSAERCEFAGGEKPDTEEAAESTAFAEEILFRSVPWGISISGMKKALTKQGVDSGSFWLFSSPDDIGAPSVGAILNNQESKNNCNAKRITIFGNSSMQVGGYEPGFILLYFAYGTSDSGKILSDADHCQFIFGRNIFTGDCYAIAEDLAGQLIKRYGEPSLVAGSRLVWTGANDTFVALTTSSSGKLFLDYGWQGGDALLQTAK